MTEAKQAWDEVTERFGSLSRRLKGSYEANASADDPRPGDTRAVEAALRTLSEAVSQVVTTVTATVRDPSFTDEAKQAGHALSGALSATFEDLGGEIRNRVGPAVRFPRPSADSGPDSDGARAADARPGESPEPPVHP